MVLSMHAMGKDRDFYRDFHALIIFLLFLRGNGGKMAEIQEESADSEKRGDTVKQ